MLFEADGIFERLAGMLYLLTVNSFEQIITH